MKRLLLILAFYVLASVGVQAQVVGEEDSIKVIWEDKQDYILYRTPIYKSFEGNSLINTAYQAWSNGVVLKNHLQKRDIETGEVVQEVEVNNPESFSTLYVSQNADLLAYKKANSLKVIFCNQSNFDSLFTIEVSESILKYQAKINNLQIKDIYEIASFVISPDDKKLILSLRIPNDIIKTKYIYDIESRQLIDSLFTKYEYTRTMLFTPDNKKFVTESIENINGSYYYYIKIYDTKDFSLIKKVRVDSTYYSLASNKNSNKIMLFTVNDNYSLIIDLINYSIKKIQVDNNYAIYGYITKNEKYMLISNGRQGNRYFYIYNLETDQIERTFDFLKASYFAYDEDNKKLLIRDAAYIGMFEFDLDMLVSVEDEIKTEQILYPNPGSYIINIPINEKSERIEIYSVRGEVVYSTPTLQGNATPCLHPDLSGQEGNYLIDISQLPIGTYFVKVYQGGSVVDYKFIKG